jgi:hypothetical protein
VGARDARGVTGLIVIARSGSDEAISERPVARRGVATSLALLAMTVPQQIIDLSLFPFATMF